MGLATILVFHGPLRACLRDVSFLKRPRAMLVLPLQTALVLPLLQSSAGVAVAASFLSRFSGPSSSTPAAASSASLVEAAVAEGVANLEERYHAWSLANPGATATKGEFWVVSTPRRLHVPCVLRNSSMRSRYT